jgi:hypothetical protein
MTERNKQHGGQKPERPSQAEGDRETIEQDLHEKGQPNSSDARRNRRSGAATEGHETPDRPSQAEGDRETIEQDLRKQR